MLYSNQFIFPRTLARTLCWNKGTSHLHLKVQIKHKEPVFRRPPPTWPLEPEGSIWQVPSPGSSPDQKNKSKLCRCQCQPVLEVGLWRGHHSPAEPWISVFNEASEGPLTYFYKDSRIKISQRQRVWNMCLELSPLKINYFSTRELLLKFTLFISNYPVKINYKKLDSTYVTMSQKGQLPPDM